MVCTVKASVDEWVRLPDVPVKVTVAVAAAAVGAAVITTLCAAPGVRLRVAGFAVTPEGRSVIATATVPVSELTAAAATLTGKPVEPPTTVKEAGVSVRAKSGGGAETLAATVEL